VVESVPGLRFPLNVCDDLRAYLPLANRLIETNGLVDPWNARRLQTVGGFTYLQALPVAVFGRAGIGVVETALASIFLAGLFVANGFRTTWARVLMVGFVIAVPLLWVPRVNTTGVLMGAPLLVAVLAATVELRRALAHADRNAATRWAIAGGVVTTALLSVRPNLGALATAYLVAGTLVTRAGPLRARLETLAAAAGAAVVALLPWSIASWRTVGTPLYPLFTGNQNRDAVEYVRAHDLSDRLDQAFELLRSGPYLWVALALLVLAVLLRRRLPDGAFAVLAALVTVGFVLVFAFIEYHAARQAFVRYLAPVAEGLAVFVAYETIRALDALPVADHRWNRVVLPVGAAVVLAAVSFSAVAVDVENGPYPAGVRLVSRALNNDLRPPPSWALTNPTLESAYHRALARLDADRTISAVDRPYLIDYGEQDIKSLDLPGFTAPGADFPFLSGPGPKIARLRAEGYDTLLATVPATEACLHPTVLQKQVSDQVRAYGTVARYYLDWEDDIDAIAKRAPGAVQKFGPLYLIDLDRASRRFPS
jgi:hypothetical protein